MRRAMCRAAMPIAVALLLAQGLCGAPRRAAASDGFGGSQPAVQAEADPAEPDCATAEARRDGEWEGDWGVAQDGRGVTYWSARYGEAAPARPAEPEGGADGVSSIEPAVEPDAPYCGGGGGGGSGGGPSGVGAGGGAGGGWPQMVHDGTASVSGGPVAGAGPWPDGTAGRSGANPSGSAWPTGGAPGKRDDAATILPVDEPNLLVPEQPGDGRGIAVIPEPNSLALISISMVALGLFRRQWN
jgi:hypothetical protein